MTTITHAVTVAGGIFAPGHLGELTQYLPFELVDDVLEQTGTVQRRLRVLPSRAGGDFVLAPGLVPPLGYLRGRCGAAWARRRCGPCLRSWPGRWPSRTRPACGSPGCAPSRSTA